MKVSIVIPAYNEEKRIGNTLNKYSTYFEELRKCNIADYEIIVVINNTTDNTETIVKEWKKRNSRIRYLSFLKGGKGYAVIEGFKDALKRDSEIIGFVDADMSTSSEAFYEIIRNIGNADAVIASRYLRGARVEPKPKLRRITASRIYNALIRALFLMPYRDTQCGAKVFKRKVLQAILPELSMSKWAFDVEFIYLTRKKGYFLKEVPSIWSDKEYSKINFAKAGPWMALAIIRLRLINSPFKFIISFYDKIIRFIP